MTRIRGGYVEAGSAATGGGDLHYLAAGPAIAQGRALVLLHETPLSARSFLPLLEALSAQGLPVVAFDTPGYGASTPLTGPAQIAGYGDAIVHGMHALGVREVILCGVHTGAAIAIEIAARAGLGLEGMPEVVAVILSGIPLLDDDGRARLSAYLDARHVADGAAGAATLDKSALLHGWRDRGRRWRDAPPELLLQALADELAVFGRRDRGFDAVMGFDLAARASEVRAPVLIVNGEHDSLAVVDAEQGPNLFPHADIAILPGLGGQLGWSAPEIYLQHIAQFALPLLKDG